MTAALELEWMRLLTGIADLGSISAAARHLRISQPAASAQLRRMESRYGVSLVVREPGGSWLTSEGREVAALARNVLAQVDLLEAGFEGLARRRHGVLNIAASPTIAEYLAPRWLASLRQSHPEVSVSMSVANSDAVIVAVEQGTVDLGFVETPRRLTSVSSMVVGWDSLVVVVDPSHRWATQSAPLERDELLQEGFVLREPGSGARETFCRALPVSPRISLEVTSVSAALAAAAAGVGPAVLSERAAAALLKSGSLVAVPVTLPLRRPLRAVWPRGREPRPPESDLIRVIAEHQKRAASGGASQR